MTHQEAEQERTHAVVAAGSLAAIALHLILRFGFHIGPQLAQWPLLLTLILGGAPLLLDLAKQLLARDFGTDVLAGLTIVTAVLLKEYLAGAIIVLMFSGGAALEQYAIRNASSVLRALARRMPAAVHRKRDAALADAALEDVAVGDLLVVFPHEICPVDGVVVEGHGVMDEAYLTGEPFEMSKAPGAMVLSGAVNGDTALTIRAGKRAADSRYARITEVMRAAERDRPRMRRLGDRLGAFYAPLAIGLGCLAWAASGQASRLLAVLVIATPCPLLIGIPVAIAGAISLSARRGIIVKRPSVLEEIDTCETMIFDKTGTLTYGEPRLSEQHAAPGHDARDVLALAASLERYSKHPLARAVVAAAKREGVALHEAMEISEAPGEGLRGTVGGRRVEVISRNRLLVRYPAEGARLPPSGGGLECVIAVGQRYAALYRFRDEPRAEGLSFIRHLGPKHRVHRVMVVSGDRESEVRRLAEQVGITEVRAGRSPEEKLAIVTEETRRARTLFVGDGINDAPALMASTVGIAIGSQSDIVSEAAGAVVMDSSLHKIDEFLHISRRMRAIALQSAAGGMALSLAGMLAAAAGLLPPVAGAVAQEAIDLLAVLNALRAAIPPEALSDF